MSLCTVALRHVRRKTCRPYARGGGGVAGGGGGGLFWSKSKSRCRRCRGGGGGGGMGRGQTYFWGLEKKMKTTNIENFERQTIGGGFGYQICILRIN